MHTLFPPPLFIFAFPISRFRKTLWDFPLAYISLFPCIFPHLLEENLHLLYCRCLHRYLFRKLIFIVIYYFFFNFYCNPIIFFAYSCKYCYVLVVFCFLSYGGIEFAYWSPTETLDITAFVSYALYFLPGTQTLSATFGRIIKPLRLVETQSTHISHSLFGTLLSTFPSLSHPLLFLALYPCALSEPQFHSIIPHPIVFLAPFLSLFLPMRRLRNRLPPIEGPIMLIFVFGTCWSFFGAVVIFKY